MMVSTWMGAHLLHFEGDLAQATLIYDGDTLADLMRILSCD